MDKWKTLEKKEISRGKIFRYYDVKRQSPDSGDIGNFDVLSFAHWVNVVAITKEGKFVFVEQYRCGTDRVTLEIPGGAIDRGEDPLVAAKRELREETGYTCEKLVHIGTVEPNPAFQTNLCHTYLVLDAKQTQDQDLDPFEEITIHEFSEKEVREKLKQGEINHALVVAAFFYYDNYLKG
ncbi:MAG: NUDIX hydrolase [Halobacteriovorax sp.]|nr:NUDIX hydrolase [Halobacteriovorax sp.]|tara:strand:- start:271611 stop:272150 length:540 start_codon:yes stop_codon:yes gene_type:complete